MGLVNLAQLDSSNQMILFSVIPLSGTHCIQYYIFAEMYLKKVFIIFILFSGVTMKDDILTAVMNEHSIAPIAPLPSRLSFCVGPRQPEQVKQM